jgi:hypothetical protein
VIEDGASEVGAGSAPGAKIPGPVIRIAGADDWFDRLLAGDPPILARRDSGDLLIDLRAVDPEDDGTIADRLLACR